MAYIDPETLSREGTLKDAQTGLPNGLHASVFLEAAWALALRGHGLAVVVLELDGTEQRGSAHEAEACEHALRTLASALTDRTRRMDLCARYSGGRFIAILVDCPLAEARRYGRDVQSRFDGSDFPWGPSKLRIGAAAIEKEMGSPEALVAAADRALRHTSRARGRPSSPNGAHLSAGDRSASPTRMEALRVLLADDDEVSLLATRRILERLGCEVTAVASSREALERVTGSEPIDLMVVDIVMPEMSGFTIVGIANRAREDLPVLYMSGYPQEEVYWGGTPGARSAFLRKPMVVNELRDAIVDLMGLGESEKAHVGRRPPFHERKPSTRLGADRVPDGSVRLEGKILVVDDDEAVVASLQRLFRRVGYATPAGLTDPRKVVDFVRAEHVDLVILDLHMPVVDGFQILASMAHALTPEEYLPVLVITGDDAPDVRRRALAAGAMDFLTKPFDPAEAEARVGNLLATRSLTRRVSSHRDLLEERISLRTAELADTKTEILHRLARAAEYRDDITGRHAERVGLMASLLAAELGLDTREVDLIRRTAPLHDIGKIGVPDAVLHKPGRLDAAEVAIMQTHTTIGAQILGGSSHQILTVAATIARGHHERWNGTGYPDGIGGAEIPLESRIVAVADVFDVLTHARPYKRAFPLEKAFQIVVKNGGSHFDPAVVEALCVIYDRVGPEQILGLADPLDPMRDIISSATLPRLPPRPD